MIQIRRAVAAGLAGWAARLLFVVGLGSCAVGLYIALFGSLGLRDPGHAWSLGLLVMGAGAAASAVGFIAAFVPWHGRGRRQGAPGERSIWYWGTWLVFGVTAVALLCLSCGLRLIGDWQRSNATVTATVSDCTAGDSDSGTTYSCTYDWDWKGVQHIQNRSADAQYFDGHRVALWIDPVTGGADDHTYTTMVYAFVGAGGVGLFDLLVCIGIAVALYQRRHDFRGWLVSLAWWRTLPEAGAVLADTPPSTAPVESTIEDTVPADTVPANGVAPGWAEDAQAPSY
jgi:hypothetical protein